MNLIGKSSFKSYLTPRYCFENFTLCTPLLHFCIVHYSDCPPRYIFDMRISKPFSRSHCDLESTFPFVNCVDKATYILLYMVLIRTSLDIMKYVYYLQSKSHFRRLNHPEIDFCKSNKAKFSIETKS